MDPGAGPDDDDTVDDARLPPDTDVGGYLIDGELGEGAMGVVYSAMHPVIGKRVAIKVLRPELSRDPEIVERFKREAQAVNRVGHPNIVDIFAFGFLPDGRSYHVMDLLVGEPLRTRLRRGPLPLDEAVHVIDQTASALIAAHDKGIVHRDLKPDNIFMARTPGRRPEVKILDWGLVKIATRPGAFRTVTGSLLGTPAYMSPEQARASESVDLRTDIYSLGVMAYELLAGRVPFARGSSIDTLVAHQEDPVPPLAAAVPGLPEELIQLIEAMLAKSPDDRPTLAAVRTVIRRVPLVPPPAPPGPQIAPPVPQLVPPAPQAPPPFAAPAPAPRSRSWIVAVLVGIAVAVGAILAYTYAL